jgi:hypothetical protein
MPAAQAGSIIPAALTWALAGIFALFALYAFSGARLIHKLPGLPIILAGIALLYLLRGLVFLPELAQLLQGSLTPPRRAIFSGVSLSLGLMYAGGLIVLRRDRRHS